MTSARTRARMIERLREQGIVDEFVLAAMNAVPRHIFVDEALAIRAYDDVPLPSGHGQTISQPWVVARMSELARNGRELDSALEVGTGCGYQTAVLAQLPKTVYTVERIHALVNKARRNLQALKIKNVRLKYGDGSADLNEDITVDTIVITAGATLVPTALLRYLTPGGRMVLPLAAAGDEERGVKRPTVVGGTTGGGVPPPPPAGDEERGVQRLTVIEATTGGVREHTYDAVRFVPLLSGLS